MQTSLTVSLKGAPDNANDTLLPNGVSILDMSLANSAPAQTGLIVRGIASSGAMTLLEGPGISVAEAALLVLRSSAPIQLELTQKSGALQIIKVNRFFAMEFDPLFPLILLRAQGVANLEYFASGLK